jgi:hypothetical protein
MPQGRSGSSRWQLNDVFVTLIVSVQIAKRAVNAISLARPRADLHGFHVSNVDTANEWNALALAPFLIHIHSHKGGLLFGI